jgi:uncharacterized protein YbaP (TraB family)
MLKRLPILLGVATALLLPVTWSAPAAAARKVQVVLPVDDAEEPSPFDDLPTERMPTRGPKLPHYTPKPALWLLADEDTKIYLFGTIHSLPPKFKWRSRAIDKATKAADELVVETYVAPGKEISEYLGFFASALLVEPRPILARVPEDRREALKDAIAKTPLPIGAYDRMQSWLAAMTLSPGGLGALGDGDNDGPGAEDALEEIFRAANKPISSVEDGKAMLARFSTVSEQGQAAMLLGAVEDVEKAGSGDESDLLGEVAWATGRVDGIIDVEKALPAEVYQVILVDRNRAWTGWLQERLKKPGTAFFAVGAAHLKGKDSVQTMLGAKGLTVTRVN